MAEAPVDSAFLVLVYGNKCLDAEGAGTAPGPRAIIWDCNGQANQRRSLRT